MTAPKTAFRQSYDAGKIFFRASRTLALTRSRSMANAFFCLAPNTLTKTFFSLDRVCRQVFLERNVEQHRSSDHAVLVQRTSIALLQKEESGGRHWRHWRHRTARSHG